MLTNYFFLFGLRQIFCHSISFTHWYYGDKCIVLVVFPHFVFVFPLPDVVMLNVIFSYLTLHHLRRIIEYDFFIFKIMTSFTLLNRGRSSLICKEGVQVFHGVVHERALLPTFLSRLQRYNPYITITWDAWICMFAVLLCFTLAFVYKVYIGFLSHMHDLTVAVVQYSTVNCC
jgi:hypothetical protein